MSIENTQFHTMVHNKPPNLTPCLEDIWNLNLSYKEGGLSWPDFSRRVVDILKHDVPYSVISANCRSFINGYFNFKICSSILNHNKDLWKRSLINIGYAMQVNEGVVSSLMCDVWLYFTEKNKDEIPRILTFNFSKIDKDHTEDELNNILGGWIKTITYYKLCSIRKKVLDEYNKLLKRTWDLDKIRETSGSDNTFEVDFTPDLLCIEIDQNGHFDPMVSENVDKYIIEEKSHTKYLECISPVIKNLGEKDRAILYYYYCFIPDDGSTMTDQKVSDLMTEKGYRNVSTRETINRRRNAVEDKLREALLNCS